MDVHRCSGGLKSTKTNPVKDGGCGAIATLYIDHVGYFCDQHGPDIPLEKVKQLALGRVKDVK